MEDFLSSDCLLASGDPHHTELELTFRYTFLAPDPLSLPEELQEKEELEAARPLSAQGKGPQQVRVKEPWIG